MNIQQNVLIIIIMDRVQIIISVRKYSNCQRDKSQMIIFSKELTSFSFFLEMLDQKHFSAEQIDFLDKFFKENPWADNAQIETIVKATGLTELIIKVKNQRLSRRF